LRIRIKNKKEHFINEIFCGMFFFVVMEIA